MSEEVAVRTATPGDRLAVRRLVDGAVLSVPDLDARIEAGDVLLAVRSDGGDGRTGRPLGTLVCEPIAGGWEVVAVAVRRSRRDRGIGRALVEAAGEREGRLVAEFDASVEPFYESLGFAIQPVDDEDRYRGEFD
ncbi:GNAT family N-acetyltransferase [Saliphagus sp. LR7]|uniref:GNAT family N-acetyltransferase n=1 Tax=Saliphagus sp. LR7 TaxID=2282654 RepID=UPI000DF73DBA|nr:GNAT family N-acetyltransferase [Saliphagus sp. LR7]